VGNPVLTSEGAEEGKQRAAADFYNVQLILNDGEFD
jgi:hypothetical protein